ncbi:MAG: CoA-binding protein [Deinococcales bacterium]|nr:CoA-binding protein [Deinococcales bacterium]
MEPDAADGPRHAHATPDAPPDQELERLLAEVRTIAVIGASAREGRPANYVPAYLREQGYDVVGVNPTAAGGTLFGQPAVATLAELDRPVDLVNVFRRDADIPGHLDDILALEPRPRAVWIQLGLRNDAVAARLRAEGITVVQDRCLMVEHRRLLGVVGA